MDMDYIFDYGHTYWIYRWKESENIKSNLTEEQRKAIQPEIYKLVSIFDKPENQNLKFDTRLLKKWAMEYNPRLSKDHLGYITKMVMANVKMHRLKRENPEKYAEISKQKIEYNKTHPEITRRGSRKRYLKIKSNPILYEKMRKYQKEYQNRKYKNDPEYKKKLAEYNKNYLKKMKEEDPEKYYVMQRIHRQIGKSTGGVRCPHCGFGIKTSTAGKNLGKRPIICPKCRHSYPKNQCEKIRIPRIFPEAQKKTEETKKQPDGMIISEQALEGLRNLGMAFENETKEPREITGNERKVAENIKKNMIEFIDEGE